MNKEKPFARKTFVISEEMDTLNNHGEKEIHENLFDIDTSESYDTITNSEFMELLKINSDVNLADKFCSNSQTYSMKPQYTNTKPSDTYYLNESGPGESMQSFTNTNNSNERYEHELQEQVVTHSETPNTQECENKEGNYNFDKLKTKYSRYETNLKFYYLFKVTFIFQ